MELNNPLEVGKLKNQILALLRVTQLGAFKRHPKGGLFGAHPLRALLAAEYLAPQGIAALRALAGDLATCSPLTGFTAVRKQLLNAEHYPSARLQLSLASTLLNRGHSIRLEAPVTRERGFVPFGERIKGKPLTEIDIQLLDQPVDIEVYTRRAQFFRTLDPEYLRDHVPKPKSLPTDSIDLICSVRTSSLLLLSNKDFGKLEDFFFNAIPRALSGEKAAPFQDEDMGVRVEIRAGSPDLEDPDFRDSIGIGINDEPTRHWLHICYYDETERGRFFLDLKKALGSRYFGGTELVKASETDLVINLVSIR